MNAVYSVATNVRLNSICRRRDNRKSLAVDALNGFRRADACPHSPTRITARRCRINKSRAWALNVRGRVGDVSSNVVYNFDEARTVFTRRPWLSTRDLRTPYTCVRADKLKKLIRQMLALVHSRACAEWGTECGSTHCAFTFSTAAIDTPQLTSAQQKQGVA